MKTRRMTRLQQSSEEDLEAAETLILLSNSQLPVAPLSLILSADLHESTCSTIGCSFSVTGQLKYCSKGHENMAKIISSQDPIKCSGSFQSRNELNSICGGLILSKSKNLQTGVPVLQIPQFFSVMPLDLPFIKNNPPAASSSWIFFHSSPPPPYQKQDIKWIPEESIREF
ncbi:hypothetical protein Bca4012_017673 [Brassica carinata]|uniref:Uncharacterized protein n=1 Tax=Brassica carinata TaxID=52824 RepID=A0A8X8BDS0_BRACI|nr:hypothetical protein Bca52824_006364 [Brassica carinata]